MQTIVEIEAKLAEGLLNYLANQKWGEVQGLIGPLLASVEQAQQKAQAGAGGAERLRAVPAVPEAEKTA